MASVPTFSPNPYANFDPSQWSDPYSPFQSGPIPFPSTYSGWPTDSMGNPIQPQAGSGIGQPSAAQIAGGPAPAAAAPASAPGTTLNSNGAGVPPGYGAAYNWTPQQQQQHYYGNIANQYAMAGAAAGAQGNGFGSQQGGGNAAESAAFGNLAQQAYAQAQAPQQAAPAAPAPAANPSGLSSAQYLQLLAHPNPVVTPGANVPVSQSAYQPNNSVLQQFLANWTPAKSGPGSGFQQAFAKGLKGS
jgi:hypothetical protein